MTTPAPDFRELLRVLLEHEVEFLVCGGVCAVLQGVPVTTMDLDLIHRRSEENVARLLAALDELDAVSRLDARRLRPEASHLLSPGHQLLETRAGLLDLLGELTGGFTYEDLAGGAETIRWEGRDLRLLSLEQLIDAKSRTGRDKDLAALPLIRHALEERKRRSD